MKYGEVLQQPHLLFDFKKGSHVSQDGFELLILLPSSPQRQDYREFPYHTGLCSAGSQTQAFVLARRACYN